MTRPWLAIALVFGVAGAAWAQVTTAQYDNARTGATLTEHRLTPAVVTVDRFGKLFSLPVDGDIYAQPLFLPRLAVPGKGVHDVVFVATEQNAVSAFDAQGAPREPLWHVTLGAPLPNRDVLCPFIRPDVGITAAPVIDPSTGTLYVLARTKESGGASATPYVQRLHALDVRTGREKFGGPVAIDATVSGRGAGAVSGSVRFDPQRENPRSALLLARGTVYLAWASSCDVVWVIGSKGWRAPDQPAVLHAFEAANVAHELYNSEQNSGRDRAGLTLRFAIPTVVDGRVYVATKEGLTFTDCWRRGGQRANPPETHPD
ncbi:MAG TPA: hypothetical protein VH116_09475, partial [Gemmatimonadales bacterium]|nr:hypothetical protein [Gemmatimonadales bacterium]